MAEGKTADYLNLGGRTFGSRLLLGTARYPSPRIFEAALSASGAEIITLSVRRINLKQPEQTFLHGLDLSNKQLLPNTAGCLTAKEAVLTAELAREATGVDWIKVEVIGDEVTLLPDSVELLKACETLVKAGFKVLPYCNDDLTICRRLEDLGCVAVMPLAAPIGTGLGIRNPHALELIVKFVKVPVIVDAGIGTASDAALAMELGCSGVLLNTAVAEAENPVLMAQAMKWAVLAGRAAYLAGRVPKVYLAKPSTPLSGRIGKNA